MSEEFEANREELQSANEEILSSNEELQSINEELETSKEELQSTNEELITINEELQRRNNDLKELSDFSKAIIETINEPILVLAPDTRIQMANKAFYAMFKTNIDRTEGHYFFELDAGQWNMPELKKKIDEIVQKNKSFDNCEITKVFPGVGEKTLLFNAMRMDQPDIKKNRILVVIQDMTSGAKQKKSQTKISK
jgi:two-component system CheB/CheR fusion protein